MLKVWRGVDKWHDKGLENGQDRLIGLYFLDTWLESQWRQHNYTAERGPLKQCLRVSCRKAVSTDISEETQKETHPPFFFITDGFPLSSWGSDLGHTLWEYLWAKSLAFPSNSLFVESSCHRLNKQAVSVYRPPLWSALCFPLRLIVSFVRQLSLPHHC